MASTDDAVTIRQATSADAEPLRAILNTIIAIGGTTAFQVPFDAEAFDSHFIGGPDCISCLVAEAGAGEAAAFQALARHPDLPLGWADIGTFARPGTRRAGVGAALFAATMRVARERGLVAINATIRADNASGIPFYDRMGFETYRVDEGVPLRDGTPVDRVSKRILLG